MKKIIIGYALMMGIISCGNNSSSDNSMYDTSARAIAGPSDQRDSLAAKVARDSSAAKAAPKPDSAAASGGGVPSGTIDSGMTNVGAQKKGLHAKPLRKHKGHKE